MKTNQEKLQELITKLSDNETTYAYTLLSKLFENRGTTNEK